MTGSSSKENRSALTSLALSMYITTGPSTAVSVNVDWLTVELMSHVSTVDDMLITITAKVPTVDNANIKQMAER